MSKITQALEKAARERLRRERGESSHAEPVVPEVPSVVVPQPGLEPIVDGTSVAANVDPRIVTYFDRHSVIAEQYRMLRTNLQSMKSSQGFHVLMVTSAMHAEGKTVTAINLALTLAQQPNCKVLLIDADLRKGNVQRWLGLDAPFGLSETLSNGKTPEQAMVRVEGSTLKILPAGQMSAEPSDLLDSDKMREILQHFKRQFDYILVDAPPVLLVSDPSIISRYVDGVLFVVRAGRTQRKQVLHAQAKLEQVRARTIGTVLTHAEYHSPFYYRYYRHYN